jgi:lipoprotein-anchoring transpeptidase ErfK/SrfK
MTQFSDRRPSSRVASALVLVSAVLLTPLAISSAANAQMLGYASAQPNGYPADEVIALDESATPERLRRAVVAFGTTEAPGTIVIDTGNTTLYYVLGQGRAIRYGVRAIRSARGRCISATACTAFTAPTIRRRSGSSSRRAVSA